MRHPRRLHAAAAAALLPLLLGGCGGAGGDHQGESAGVAARPDRGNRIIIGLQQEPDKLNTALNAMVYGTYISQCIYGYFVKFDQDMHLVPDVIEEVPTVENGGISADNLTYTYHLRKGLRWHDGHPFTAADVLFSVDVILDPRHEVESRIGFDKIDHTDAPDEYTVVFHLKEPYAPFVSDTFFDEPILPKHLLEDKVGVGFGQAAFHRAPVGLGPFKFKEWVDGSHVTVVRNDDYFRGPPALDEITFRFIPDINTLLVALQSGEIDGYDNAGTDQYDRLKEMPGIKAYVTPQLMWEHVDFNTEDPILKDVRVRRAIQLAIDRGQISREICEGLWPPAHGDVNPRLPWYNPEVEKLVRYNPDAAARLLDEAGWKPGADGIRVKDGTPLRLSISTTAGRMQRELTEQVLQQQLRRIGVELTIENYNATAFFAPFEDNGVIKRGRFQLAMYAWISTPDPDRFTLYHSSQVPPPEGQNHPRFRNARLDRLIDEGLRTASFEKRKPIYDEIQVILATEVPMTPLVWRSDIDPMTTRLRNFKPNPTQTGDTWNAHEWALR